MGIHYFKTLNKFRSKAEKDAFKKEVTGMEVYHPYDHHDIAFNHVFGGPILVMRHSQYQTIEQPVGSIKGKYDGPLTEHGISLINQIASQIQEFLPIGIVIATSTAQRAVETGTHLSHALEQHDTITVKNIQTEAFCEGYSLKMSKEYVYANLRNHGLFIPNGISCVTIVITHQPNIERYDLSIEVKNRDERIGYLDAISENGMLFKNGIPKE